MLKLLKQKSGSGRRGGPKVYVADTKKPLFLERVLRRQLWDSNYRWAVLSGQFDSGQLRKLKADKTLYLEVITEVYYARAVDISISSKSSFGFRLFVRREGERDSGTVTEKTATNKTETTEPKDDSTTTKKVDTSESTESEFVLRGNAFERASKLNERLREVDALTVPGGSFQFLSVSDRSVSMRRTFLHPIAIGYRGLTVSVDVESGQITIGGAISGSGRRPLYPGDRQPKPKAKAPTPG